MQDINIIKITSQSLLPAIGGIFFVPLLFNLPILKLKKIRELILYPVAISVLVLSWMVPVLIKI